MKTGIFPAMTFADYLALEAVSASVLHELDTRCPIAAWHSSYLNPVRLADDTAASDAGTIAHEILLCGSESCVEVIDPADHPAEKTGSIPDGWTNKSIRTARDKAREAGKIPVLKSTMGQIRSMVASARGFVDSLYDTERAIWVTLQPNGGESEVSMLWTDDGIPCRIRPDRISVDRSIVIDVKTTKKSAHPNAWGRTIGSDGHALRAAFYRRGIRELAGADANYLFLVCEQSPPYLCSLIGLDPAWIQYGESHMRNALRLWRDCVERDIWQGYPSRAAYPELPPWLAPIDDDETDAQGIPYDVSKLFKKSEA